jgi:protein phosphatase
MPAVEACGETDPGLVRQNNEDSLFLDQSLGLAIVADGMGGASCGEIASALTVEAVVRYVRQPPVNWPPAQLLEEAIQEANRCVLDRASSDASCAGMGSTIVAALWNLPEMVIANVGDSRAYLWRNQTLTQLSYDQTLVNELRLRFGLTEEEVSSFPHRNVLTMAVGSAADLRVRVHTLTLEARDQVLLCSDGLSGPVPSAEIASILATSAPAADQVRRLVEAAKTKGAPDNVTAILLRYQE